MKRISLLSLSFLAMFGCGEQRENDESIPFDKVPPSIVKIAEQKLPGVKFETAYKETKNGKEVYELRGKTKEGKIRDMEITADGQVLEVD